VSVKYQTDNHRLSLHRSWIGSGGTVNWVMLNPSKADDTFDDPTIRKCIGFSKRWGFARMSVTNLFTFRATDPRDLRECARCDYARAVGYADRELIRAAAQADLVIAAWGIHGNMYGRADDVLTRVLPSQRFRCIGLTQAGFPSHPVMHRYTDAPVIFREPLFGATEPLPTVERTQPDSTAIPTEAKP
jgi:hypothetical protein